MYKTQLVATALAAFAVFAVFAVFSDTPEVEVETAFSFCPYYPKMIWHCEYLEEIIDKGGIASRTA